MPRTNINALEPGHRKPGWSAARDRADMRAALRAMPANLFAAIIAALEDDTPHALDMRATLRAENEARYKRYLRSNPD